MPMLRVLANDKGDVVGTARTDVPGWGAHLPRQVTLVARPGQRVMEITVDDEVASLETAELHDFIKARYLRSPTDPPPTSEQKDDGSPDVLPKKPTSPSEDLVITPAGPVRRDNVHPVRPDEVVRRNLDGTYTVARRAGSSDSASDGRRRPTSTRGKRKKK
jgi:hypothetical protein